MGACNTKIVGNIICSKLMGELDVSLAREWVEKLEEHETNSSQSLNRFHDVRDINAIHLSFDELWSIAQRRLDTYKSGVATKSAFWVNTPLNYGVARMYQALTDGTPFRIEVFYKLEQVASFLGIDEKVLSDVDY